MKLKSLMDFEGRRPMTKEESESLLICTMLEMQRGNDWVPDDMPTYGTFLIMEDRIKRTPFKVDFTLMMFASSLCNTPGGAVTWAYTLCALAEKSGESPVGMDEFVQEFPMGIPTEDAMHACWDAQKEKGAPLGNGYDDGENWEVAS